MYAGDSFEFDLNIALLFLTEFRPCCCLMVVGGFRNLGFVICSHLNQFARETLALTADYTHHRVAQSDVFDKDLRTSLEETPKGSE